MLDLKEEEDFRVGSKVSSTRCMAAHPKYSILLYLLIPFIGALTGERLRRRNNE